MAQKSSALRDTAASIRRSAQDPLGIYLNDHLAGATAGLELARRVARGGVIFDVDGTLLDTNYLHVTAWWEAFRERGHDVACADIHRAIGLSSEDMITQVLGQPDPSSVSAAHSRYIAPYLGRMRPLAGAADLLRSTGRLGLNVVLATSAKDEELDLMMDALGARDAVGTVVSSGDVKKAKPDPEIVRKALDESGTDPARAVMVGDTVWDVLAAQRAGLPCIGLLSGGISDAELRGAGAEETYPGPAALLEQLTDSAIGRVRAG
jgi:phosphoglycolate phosphatase-like HAD superfamily hydrolase